MCFGTSAFKQWLVEAGPGRAIRLFLFGAVAISAPSQSQSLSDPNGYRSIDDVARLIARERSTAVPCVGGRGELRVFDTPRDATYKPSVQYIWIVLPKACATLRIAMIETAGDIVELFRKHAADSAVVITGGFRMSGNQNVAEGLHVSRSATLRPRADWKSKESGSRLGGFLAQGVSTVEILPASISDAQLAAYPEVIQSKPVLLEAGRSAIVRDNFERANRVALLIGKDGDIGVLGAFGSAISATYSLYELSILAGMSSVNQDERSASIKMRIPARAGGWRA